MELGTREQKFIRERNNIIKYAKILHKIGIFSPIDFEAISVIILEGNYSVNVPLKQNLPKKKKKQTMTRT